MKKSYLKAIRLFFLLSDLILLNASFLLAYLIIQPGTRSGDAYIGFHVFISALWFLGIVLFKTYKEPRAKNILSVWIKTFKAILIHGAVVVGFAVAFKSFTQSMWLVLLGYVLFTLSIFLWKFILLHLFEKSDANSSNLRKIIIVGGGATSLQLYNYFNSNLSLGYKFAGFFDDDPEQFIYKDLVKGKLENIQAFVESNPVHEMYCALPLTQSNEIRKLMNVADNNLIRFKVVPDLQGFINTKVDIDLYYDIPVLSVRAEPLENYTNRFVKRAFDVVFSLGVILAIFPFLIPVLGILIKVSSPGPIFFKQLRTGRNNKKFICYKFRSMRINSEADQKQVVSDDPRLTNLGRFLRRTNLDEMPQFINVLAGQMSVVGPRPHMLNHTEECTKLVNKFLVRHFVKPGITGWAQVKGLRGPTNDKEKLYKRVKADVWYVENWTLPLDIKIIILTVLNMVRGDKQAG